MPRGKAPTPPRTRPWKLRAGFRSPEFSRVLDVGYRALARAGGHPLEGLLPPCHFPEDARTPPSHGRGHVRVEPRAGLGHPDPVLTLVLATRNRHKAAEILAVLGAEHCYVTLASLPEAPEVIEDAGSFAGNATKKASELARWLRLRSGADPGLAGAWVLADDSGLEVDALGGAPGVHSARFAALETGRPGNASDAENNARLLRLLEGVPPERRTGRFHCVIALVRVAPGVAGEAIPEIVHFDGVCEGRVLESPRGTAGFGYDPLFLPDGEGLTFAELGEAAKNRISHRARALAGVRTWLGRRPELASSPAALSGA